MSKFRIFLLYTVLLVVLPLAVWAGFATENGKLIISSDNISLQPKCAPIALPDIAKHATAPTAATKGTTPTVKGWLFDATNEKYQLQINIPQDWDGVSDLIFCLRVVLNQAETATDDINWSADYIVATPDYDLASKTSTAITGTKEITNDCAGDGCLYHVHLTIDYDDADNPVTWGDVLIMEIYRTDVGNCGGVILVAANLGYETRF